MSTRTMNGVELPVAGTWNIDPSHSGVNFVVRHLMVGKTRGRFADWSGAITIAEDPAASTVEVTIQAASIDTKDAGRDGHLQSPDFLDVANFPTITFVSKSVSGAGDEWKVLGDLTIHGVTREVELALDYEGSAKDPWGGSRVAFEGATEIDREEFGLTWNAALEAGGVLVGKKVKIEFEVEAVLQA